jgi:hypothetical protein
MSQQQQQLSHKDGALFRQVVRHFENKQYKKGKKPQLGERWRVADEHLQVSKPQNRSCARTLTMPTLKR